MDAQLTIFDALDELDRQDAGMRRLGAGPELGMVLLMPLTARGWRLHRVRTFGGSPHPFMFILANGVHQVRREGAVLGDVATDLFEEASKLTGAAA